MPLLSPYRAVLRTPHACAAFAASLVGRLCYGIVSLSLILTLTAGGRNYGFAGFVMALFGLTVVLASPFRAYVARLAAGLLVTAGLAVAGTGLFLRSPALGRRKPTGGRPAPRTRDAAPARAGAGRTILALALATGAIGLCLGGLGLVVVAFSQARHDPAAVAWVEAAMSAGSALGGLGYGAVAWRIAAQRRLVLLIAGLAVVLLPAAFSPTLAVLALLAGLAGVLVSPTLATAYVLTDSLAPPQARNRVGNWVNSGYNAGSSAGSVLTGQLIGRIPLTACLPVLAAPTLPAVLPLLRLRFTAAGEQPAAPGGLAGSAVLDRPLGRGANRVLSRVGGQRRGVPAGESRRTTPAGCSSRSGSPAAGRPGTAATGSGWRLSRPWRARTTPA